MKKIPTLFERDWDGNPALVTDKIAVELPEGATATRKWDGTAVLVQAGRLFKRYTLRRKFRKMSTRQAIHAPLEFIPADEPDMRTGKQPGWVPVHNNDSWYHAAPMPSEDGTYELVGPKVQGNAEGFSKHLFVPHGTQVFLSCPTDYDGLKRELERMPIEGIVWWFEGKPVAKIKRRDFGLPWPLPEAMK